MKHEAETGQFYPAVELNPRGQLKEAKQQLKVAKKS